MQPFYYQNMYDFKSDENVQEPKSLTSAAIESEVADVLRMNEVSEEVINLVCDIIVDHFATAIYLEQNDK